MTDNTTGTAPETGIDALVEARTGTLAFHAGMSLGQLAKTIAASGCFGTNVNPYVAAVKILAGQEIGIGPVESMRGLHVFEGKIELGAAVMASKIKGSGFFDYEVLTLDADTGCVLKCFEKSNRTKEWAELPNVSFTMAEAKRAGLLAKRGPWQTYPTDMCFARAMARFFRRYCPHLAGGAVYAEGEISTDLEGTEPKPPKWKGGQEGAAVEPEQPSKTEAAPAAEGSQESHGEPSWVCEGCGQTNAGGYTVCGKCDLPKDEVKREASAKQPLKPWPDEADPTSKASTPGPAGSPTPTDESSTPPPPSTTAPANSSTDQADPVDPTPAAAPEAAPSTNTTDSTESKAPENSSGRDENTEPVEHPYGRFCAEAGEVRQALLRIDGGENRYREVFAARGMKGRADVKKGATRVQREILMGLHEVLAEALSDKAESEAKSNLEVVEATAEAASEVTEETPGDESELSLPESISTPPGGTICDACDDMATVQAGDASLCELHAVEEGYLSDPFMEGKEGKEGSEGKEGNEGPTVGMDPENQPAPGELPFG